MPSNESLQPDVYDALRARAGRILDGQGAQMSPTSLVHDVLVKIYRSHGDGFRDEVHFRAVAAMAMRQILIDRARKRATQKHGANALHISLSGIGTETDPIDLIALQQGLTQLEKAHPRAARISIMRLFGDLEVAQIAQALECSPSTVKREWRIGSAWLRMAVRPEP